MRFLAPDDASKLAVVAYKLVAGHQPQRVLEGLSFDDPFALEVAQALTGTRSVSDEAKRVAAGLAESAKIRMHRPAVRPAS